MELADYLARVGLLEPGPQKNVLDLLDGLLQVAEGKYGCAVVFLDARGDGNMRACILGNDKLAYPMLAVAESIREHMYPEQGTRGVLQ